ncbi:hypothetical protein BKA70DRAFT_1233943 [Coprinopsis sp. MPI-PUGE-AT-0042]|nr:hypothetical protein BKA70DRAFT_1233943 [Coprinopsis sp. MPI-PUGE-AT-0042]
MPAAVISPLHAFALPLRSSADRSSVGPCPGTSMLAGLNTPPPTMTSSTAPVELDPHWETSLVLQIPIMSMGLSPSQFPALPCEAVQRCVSPPPVIRKYQVGSARSQSDSNKWLTSGSEVRAEQSASFHSAFLQVAQDAARLSCQVSCLWELVECPPLCPTRKSETPLYHGGNEIVSTHLLTIPADVPACAPGWGN